MTALLLAGLLLLGSEARSAPADQRCFTARVTGYVRGEGSPWTYDGTSIWEEGIAAAGWNIRLGSMVWVDGLGTFRVADRGMLGPDHIDIAVYTRREAFAITGWRAACLTPP